jgi:Rad3-related DNA helicase
MGDIVKDNYQLYNYLTLLTFGQQIGRINRSEVDYGATFLIDSRFPRFIAKNSSSIPKWVSKAMIVK